MLKGVLVFCQCVSGNSFVSTAECTYIQAMLFIVEGSTCQPAQYFFPCNVCLVFEPFRGEYKGSGGFSYFAVP